MMSQFNEWEYALRVKNYECWCWCYYSKTSFMVDPPYIYGKDQMWLQTYLLDENGKGAKT